MCVSAEQRFRLGVNYTAQVLGWNTADPVAIRTGKGEITQELNRKVDADKQAISYIKECESMG